MDEQTRAEHCPLVEIKENEDESKICTKALS